jgi:hypothetical protein
LDLFSCLGLSSLLGFAVLLGFSPFFGFAALFGATLFFGPVTIAIDHRCFWIVSIIPIGSTHNRRLS